MGKWTGLGAVMLAVVGFLIFAVVNFTGDIQNHSIIEPVGASLTLGEMRTNPHDSYQLNEDSYGLVGEKGMLASDFMAEVTKELIEDKPKNSMYYVWWGFKDSEGNFAEGLKPSIIEAGREGNFDTGEVLQARDIIDTQLDAGVSAGLEDDVRDMVIQEAIFKVNRYDNSQIIKEGENTELGEVGEVKDLDTPINSTTYKWSLYKDALVYEDFDRGEGFNVGGIDIDTHIDIGVNKVEGDNGVKGTESGYPDPVEEDKKFEVTFVNDGRVVSRETVSQGGTATTPNGNGLSKDGHTFNRWEGNYSNVQQNEVVQAVWELDSIKSKTITLREGKEHEQIHTIRVDDLYEIEQYRVDRGNIEIEEIRGDTVRIKVSGRPADRIVQTGGSYTPSSTRYVNNQSSPYYNSGGYRGYLNKFVFSGTDTDSKYVSGQTSSYYSSSGYVGSLSRYVYYSVPSRTQTDKDGNKTTIPGYNIYRYRGTVVRPDTRVWKYRGYVEKGESDTRTYQNYYQYKVTINYREK